jgi:hypothetical protein
MLHDQAGLGRAFFSIAMIVQTAKHFEHAWDCVGLVRTFVPGSRDADVLDPVVNGPKSSG